MSKEPDEEKLSLDSGASRTLVDSLTARNTSLIHEFHKPDRQKETDDSLPQDTLQYRSHTIIHNHK